MYVVGFYSPREKSGVTEMALAVARYLRMEKQLSVSFVSNGVLQNEPLNDYTIDQFAALPTRKQKQIMKRLKKQHDLIIYDASTPHLSEKILELLPLADRVFVLRDDDPQFQSLLYSILELTKQFNPKMKDFLKEIHNDGHYMLPHHERIGFTTPSSKNVASTGEIIYQHFQMFKLHLYYVTRFNRIKERLLKTSEDKTIVELAYESGLDFRKAVLFELFVIMRQMNGQSYAEIVDDLFPLFVEKDFSALLQLFEQEWSITSIRMQLLARLDKTQ